MHHMFKKSSVRFGLLVGFLLIVGIIFGFTALAGPAYAGEEEPPDHSLFPQLQAEFASGPEVTQACLECHVDAGSQVMATTHWTWEYATEDGQQLGKNNVINNYCVAVASNWPRCTSCHVGYGYSNPEAFAEMDEGAVDCLVCHDTTGTYKKFPTAAGHPVYEETEFSGKTWSPPDLTAIAQAVGMPTRANCGSCHFNGGGGPNVKHGDLDVSMVNPSYEIDVHMDAEGLNFTCQACHTTEEHAVAGSHYEFDLASESTLKTCQTCHTDAAHENEMLNTHTARVACQTCHISIYAKENATKVYWDWSVAGDKERNVEKDENGLITYHFKKGAFEWGIGLTPDYMWFNGDATFITLDDEFDPETLVPINALHGDRADETAVIFPMKSFYAVQPYDAGTNKLVVPNLFPTNPETAFWKNWDWALAAQGGQAVVGREFSGEIGWVNTVMYWPLTHQVSPADQALACEACHSAESILDFVALGYSEEEAAKLQTFPPGE